MSKKLIYIIVGFLFLVLVVIATAFTINKNNQTKIEHPNKEQVTEEIKTTTIYFVGDMMLTRGVKMSVDKNFSGDYNHLFDNLKELREADILFANLEGAVSDTGNNVGSKYSFRMDPIVLSAIKKAGFDIVSFANNHVGDWNTAAFKDTLSRLKENGILKTGAGLNKEEAASPTIIEKNQIKFGFLGFTDVGPNWLEAKQNKAGILLASDPNFKEIVREAKTKCDVLIVSFHFGEEYKLTHNKRQEYLAHTAIENGADLIIGHHPHVIQDQEKYLGKTIVYSLGNFIFDQYFSRDTMRGMLFEATFKDKTLIKTNHRIITLNKKYQPEGIFSVEEIKEKDNALSSTCPKPKKDYEDMSRLNIGQKTGLLDKSYIPNNLNELDLMYATKKEICLTQETIKSFEKMAEKAKEDGLTIKVSSGFRSYETQKIIFDNILKTSGNTTSISVAKPGHSEHQLGTTIDITGLSINYDSAVGRFDKTPEDLWLKENAYLYGFIQSYPKGKESVTGYMYEPWHYRYLGSEAALQIKNSGLTISEFL